MDYVQKLARIVSEKIGNKGVYCIHDSTGKLIAGQGAGGNCLSPDKNGGWRVFIQELARADIYEDYHLETEREACIKFIEITEDKYHLSKYLSVFIS